MLFDLPIRYALFDMDGTLTDTMAFWMEAADAFLRDEGVSLTEKQSSELNKLGVIEGIAFVRALHVSPRTDSFGMEDICRILKQRYENESVLKTGVGELLSALRARGVKMGVATLTPSPLARICLSQTGILSYFDFILGGEAYPEGKSAPRVFLDAAEKFGCAPREMHLFEDSLYSIKTARALGIPTVGVADKYQEEERADIINASVAFFEDGFARRVK